MFSRIVNRVAKRQGVRFMGDHHHAPKYTGLDAVVRKYLKEDHHVVLGILGLYATIILVAKVWPSKPKVVAPLVIAAAPSSGDMPSVDSPEFGEWLSQDGNFEKLFE